MATNLQCTEELHAHPSLRARMAGGARTAARELSWSSVFVGVYQRYNEIRPPETRGRIAILPLRERVPLALAR